MFRGAGLPTVYCFDEATGFTSPTWNDLPVVRMGPISPVTEWVIERDFPYDTDLLSDSNGDGVSLLMAYALNLVPHNALIELPQAIMGPSTLGMESYASAPGIACAAQTSTGMENWETEDVTLSDLDSAGNRTASIDRSTSRRFIRLAVAEE